MQLEQIYFDTIGSTNTWAKQNTSLLKQNTLTVVSAGEQTAGRGRIKRKWISPSNQNIYASFCFWIPVQSVYLPNIAQVLALSAIEMLEQIGFSPILKWPNDIVLSQKKLGGILCETVIEKEQICVIAGIGLNINMPSDRLNLIDQPATSLLNESKTPFNLEEILQKLTTSFIEHLRLLQSKGFDHFLKAYQEKLSCRQGDRISFHIGRERIEGFFDSIETNGSINLRVSNGMIQNYTSGQVM